MRQSSDGKQVSKLAAPTLSALLKKCIATRFTDKSTCPPNVPAIYFELRLTNAAMMTDFPNPAFARIKHARFLFARCSSSFMIHSLVPDSSSLALRRGSANGSKEPVASEGKPALTCESKSSSPPPSVFCFFLDLAEAALDAEEEEEEDRLLIIFEREGRTS
jgi:hypothetical protein